MDNTLGEIEMRKRLIERLTAIYQY